MSEKYYLIRVENLKWGVIERRIDDLKQAKVEYARLKHKFKNVHCAVVLLSVNHTDEDYIEKVVYKKPLGADAVVLDILNDMTKLVEKFKDVCQINQQLLNAYEIAPGQHKHGQAHLITHGLEILKLSQTTGEERDQILYNLEEALSIRRSAKEQMLHAKYCSGNMKNIVNSIKTCLGHINKEIEKSERYDGSKAAVVKNESYFNALGLDYRDFYPEAYPEALQDDYLEEVDKMINDMDEKEEFDKYNDKYFEYEEFYA